MFPSGAAQGGGPLGEWEVKESLKKPQKYITRKGSTGAPIARLHQIHSVKPHCPFKTVSYYLLGLSILEECEAAEQVGQEGARRVQEQTKSLFFIEDLRDLQSTALEIGG